VVGLLYDDLQRLAHSQLSRSNYSHTLQPTALVHEVFERLNRSNNLELNDRLHFLGLSARIMRQVLVDYLRNKQAAKRGSGNRITLHTNMIGEQQDIVDLLALDQALNRMSDKNPEHVQVVELRYFGGLSIEETAAAMGQSVSTINRSWRSARAWLYLELNNES